MFSQGRKDCFRSIDKTNPLNTLFFFIQSVLVCFLQQINNVSTYLIILKFHNKTPVSFWEQQIINFITNSFWWTKINKASSVWYPFIVKNKFRLIWKTPLLIWKHTLYISSLHSLKFFPIKRFNSKKTTKVKNKMPPMKSFRKGIAQ